MKSATEAEARALLAAPSLLQDAPGWQGSRARPWHQAIDCGLLRLDGTRAGLQARLEWSYSRDTSIRTYQFSIFRAQLYGLQRVYQLTVARFARPTRDAHRLSHEHLGDMRSGAQPAWSEWTFEQTMSYFCQRTNLAIDPPIDDPEQLRLKP